MTNTSAARPVLNGRYELHRRIARGGMADVFLAKDQLLDRPVAVKVMFPQYAADPTFVARFKREAQAAANLNHPSIVAVYDWGEHDQTYFIVMEYVEGHTLADLITSEGPLDPDRAAAIAMEVAVALGFAHRNGTVHRDVKPGNIMINQQGQIKVADFGIARAFGGSDDELTQTGSVMGTASYFSPEQAQGQVVDPRSDLYSLGVVLFEMVVGQTPFVGNTPVAIAYKHVQEPPPRATSRNPNVPPALDALIYRLLQKDPAARYPAAEEVRFDLARFREGLPLVGAGTAGVGTAATAMSPAQPHAAQQSRPDQTLIMNDVGTTAAMPSRGPDTGTSRAVIDTSRAVPASAAIHQTEPVEEYYEPPSRTGVFVVMLGILLVGLVGLIFYLSNQTGGPAQETEPEVAAIAVPFLTGENVNDASDILRADGLIPDYVWEPNSAEPSTVFRTEPEGGTEVAEGDTVKLYVSQLEDLITIPPVVNMTLEEAKAALDLVQLRSQVSREWSDTVPDGIVISSNPLPNDKVSPDFSVELIVSQGPQQLEIPQVAGLSPLDASAVMEREGFSNISYDNTEGSASVPKDKVIRTEPAEGQKISLDSNIKIFVSQGPLETFVPDLFGKDQETAQQWLEENQLVPQFEPVPVAVGDERANTVIDVQPGVGSSVRQGDTVIVRIAKESSDVTTSTETTVTTTESTESTDTTATTAPDTTTTQAGDGG